MIDIWNYFRNGTRTITETVSQTQEGKWQWRDLIPVIKLDISAVRINFLNRNFY